MNLQEIEQEMLRTPEANTPFYQMQNANEPILLYKGSFDLEKGGEQFTGNGSICFDWLPTPEVKIALDAADQEQFNPITRLGVGECSLRVPGASCSCTCLIVKSNMTWGENAGAKIEAIASDSICFESGATLSRAIFHLVNFPAVICQPNRYASYSGLGRVETQFGGWKLIVDNVENINHLREQTKEQRGYGITHVLHLERADGALFTVDEARNVQSALHWFLSFSTGAFASPMLPIGFGEQGEVVWKEWHALRVSPHKSARGWLSDRQYVSQSWKSALEGFWKCWNNPIWNDSSGDNPLLFAIHWFISANSNDGGIEGSIILAQTGLELISWVKLVEDERIFADTVFDSGQYRSAQRKFEELLLHTGVDATIPATLPRLAALAMKKNWASGPQALIAYRNTIVHPSRRSNNQDVKWRESYEILELVLWYLELSLLHLFEYQGYYVNRVSDNEFAGVTEKVPWTP